MLSKELRDFTLTLLDDDNGISEDAWYRLCDLLQASGEFELLGELSAQIDSCDSRYFISSLSETPDPGTSEILKAWADEKEDYGHLIDIPRSSED